jgi:hypothetical protein
MLEPIGEAKAPKHHRSTLCGFAALHRGNTKRETYVIDSRTLLNKMVKLVNKAETPIPQTINIGVRHRSERLTFPAYIACVGLFKAC